MVYIGIDISKGSFVAAYPSASGYRTNTFPNTIGRSSQVHRYTLCL